MAASGLERRRCACPCRRRFDVVAGGLGRPRIYYEPSSCKFRAYRRRRKLRRTESVDWYTPLEVFEVGLELAELDRFDLDPATSERAPIWPLVSLHYTKNDDGLARPWVGNVWCNPPYGRVIARWVAKAIEEARRDPDRVILLLVPAKTDTRWWSNALKAGFQPYFIEGRIRFIEPRANGELRRMGSGKFPSAWLAFRSAQTATKVRARPSGYTAAPKAKRS